MALGDAEHARIGRPARALRERAVHDEPSLGPEAVALAQLELQGAAGTIQRPGSVGEVAHRMGRVVDGERHGAQDLGKVARGGERRRAGEDEKPPFLEHSD